MNVQTTTEAVAPAGGTGVIIVAGERYMRDGAGRLVPADAIKPEHFLEDQTVRSIVKFAEELSAQITRFRGHTFDDVGTFIDLLAERYGARRGGKKGNVTLTSYDNLLKVVVQVQDQIVFGPELQIAKGLVDTCITEWAAGTRAEIRALVEHAFQVDKEGRIDRSALFQLRRLNIEDPKWISAMRAIGDAIRVVGSKEYVRFYRRKDLKAHWEPITIDLAQADGGAL